MLLNSLKFKKYNSAKLIYFKHYMKKLFGRCFDYFVCLFTRGVQSEHHTLLQPTGPFIDEALNL